MNDLVKERSGLDILSMAGDLPAAKEAAAAFLGRDDLDHAKLGVEKATVRGGIADARSVRLGAAITAAARLQHSPVTPDDCLARR